MPREDRVDGDRDTIHRGDLHYHASYDPTVAPFKRFSVTDQVQSDFSLVVSDRRLRPVPVQRWVGAGQREFFWGSYLVLAGQGKFVPIPSVAPDMVPHKVVTRPDGFDVRFYKDGADNFYLKVSGPSGGARPVRILARVSASRSYFGGRLPSGPWRTELGPLAPKLPPNVARSAHQVLAYIGAKLSDPLPESLQRLVEYFRSFRQGRLDLKTGISYLDLALSQRGVCRHRSYAFVITAQALSIPARYVSNEAHAFVEVYLPRTGFRRIDLGGASPQLNVHNARGKKPHRPPGDPFPRPDSFINTQGLSASGLHAPADPDTVDPNRLDPGQRGRRLKDLSSGSAPGTWVDAKSLGLAGDPASPDPAPDTANPPDPGTPPGPPSRSDPRSLEVGQISVASTGIRGRPLTVTGTLTDREGPARKVRVVVVAYRRGDEGAVVLGETLSDGDGRFRLSGAVPSEIPVGYYHIYAVAPSQSGHRPAISR